MIVIGTTLAAFVMDMEDTWSSWLKNAEQTKELHEVTYFAAIEVDARGVDPFAPLIQRIEEVGGTYFTYSLDDGRTEVTSANRLRHICAGRNIVHDFAVEQHASHILFLDADTMAPADAISKLLELNHPLVGGQVDTYCLSGPKVDNYQFHVEEHMNTAGFLMVGEPLLTRLRWRWDWEMTDDPCFHKDAIEFFNIPTYVRKDVKGKHFPQHIPPIEQRGHKDMKVYK